jgi:hypothetical protein
MQEHANALYRIAPLRDDACIELPYMGHTRSEHPWKAAP